MDINAISSSAGVSRSHAQRRSSAAREFPFADLSKRRG
jgi:hypothetical protein